MTYLYFQGSGLDTKSDRMLLGNKRTEDPDAHLRTRGYRCLGNGLVVVVGVLPTGNI